MLAYNERVLTTSRSAQRLEKARRQIVNLQPHLERLQTIDAEHRARQARIEAAAPLASAFDGQLQRGVRDRVEDRDYAVVWDGSVR
jgi:hypothetical protein